MAQPYAPLLQQMMQEFQGQRLESAERLARSILRINPKDLVALQVQGLSMAIQGRVAESVEPFSKASVLDSKNPELLNNLAKAQHGANLFADAAKTYEKLNRLVPNNAQLLTDMGTSYAKSKDFDKAFSLYDRAIELQPDYFLVWSNRGNLLAELSFNAEALVSYQKSLELNPNYPEAWTNYGNALFSLGRFAEAASAHERALSLNPNYAEAWSNHGNALLELKMGEEAYESYQKAYALKPLHPYLMGQLLSAKLTSCIWDDKEPSVKNMLDLVARDTPATIPFALLQTPADLDLQKRCAQIFIADRYPKHPSFSESLNKADENKQKMKIGYFSSDFKNHPVGILMQNLIQHHDRSRYEIVGFFLNSKSGDEVERSLLDQFDESYDLFGMNDVDARNLVLEQNIDIAIDLNGHTSGARTGLFSRKIAPFQLNYLGYAGTSGSDFYDGLVADAIAISPNHEPFFTEKILRLPHSFFPLDTSIHPDTFGELPSRASQGLPESGFIFSCFNNPYKINPEIFDIWMRLLESVPESVLWLSKTSDKVVQNLRAQAEARGIDPNRLVFATRVPERKDHLSRLRLADLFLDTPHYNAHATAADALWAGVPVLTVIGDTFAGRVAASQLNAAGMPELIVQSNEDYYQKALELATKPEYLSEIRSQLEANRFTAPLFNSKQYVQDLEQLFLNLTSQSS
ncbi:glycosyltransferase family 41 protein [Polynucleobacter sp. MWH-UH2A]|uniref:O-linked N-acetylglucosamine transferase, SPINDLY family protein n=1 Tax=Polynucleobacter sp. MWH-UH2A TaxID=1855617 RepID=UPI001BFD30DD|nr:glycosyltransferase family 41 protein [Polynucleobacter sp. MWH-UH2A]QWD64975.1 tetratricopeptide repeat protein [Polynucleobacter sp. MWH-UH2A]